MDELLLDRSAGAAMAALEVTDAAASARGGPGRHDAADDAAQRRAEGRSRRPDRLGDAAPNGRAPTPGRRRTRPPRAGARWRYTTARCLDLRRRSPA